LIRRWSLLFFLKAAWPRLHLILVFSAETGLALSATKARKVRRGMQHIGKAGFAAFCALACAEGAFGQPAASRDPSLVGHHVNVELRAIHAAVEDEGGRPKLLLFTSSLPESSCILVEAELASPLPTDLMERFKSFTRAQDVSVICNDVRVFKDPYLPTTSSHFYGKASRCRLEPGGR